MDDDELSALIRRQATRHRAGDRLRAGVQTQIALQLASNPASADHPVPARRFALAWRSAAAGFVAGAVLVGALGWFVPRLAVQQSLPGELVASHVRALKAGPLIEVASSDYHTVKPWFQGKLDYAPQVVDLEAEGFALLGGRVEHVAGAPASALAYTRGHHVLSVFVWPAAASEAPQPTQRSGFNLLHWSDGAMQVWVVSDAERATLQAFGQAWRARVAAADR